MICVPFTIAVFAPQKWQIVAKNGTDLVTQKTHSWDRSNEARLQIFTRCNFIRLVHGILHSPDDRAFWFDKMITATVSEKVSIQCRGLTPSCPSKY